MQNPVTPVHPELRQAVKMMPHFTFSRKNLKLIRFMMHFQGGSKIPKTLRVVNLFISSQIANTQIRLRIYRPKQMVSGAPGLLWLHGGGYIIGKPELDDGACMQYAQELGIVVVSADYSLAPEHPFPAALEDSYAALLWMRDHAAELGFDPSRIAIGGESAGGGLAAALVQYACDHDDLRPVFQLLVYPMLDDRTCAKANVFNPAVLTWNSESNRFGWEAYLGLNSGEAEMPAYAVPARRETLAGLPPAWIGVGTLDLFHEEDVAYAQRLSASGVRCELVEVQGAFHGFDVPAAQTSVVRAFRTSQMAALKAALFPDKG